jgi:predicted negative regulator of RcsB-dependent stress response
MIIGLAIAFGGLFGFKQWTAWQDGQKQRASSEFMVMSELLGQDQLDAAMANYQTLRDDFGSSPYASLAALQMARARFEAGQADLAISLYEDVIEKGTPRALTVVARGRLARVLADLGRAEEALAVLDGAEDVTGFEALFAEIRGDIRFRQGDLAEATSQWQLALDTMEAGAGDRATLELKLESAAEGMTASPANSLDGVTDPS